MKKNKFGFSITEAIILLTVLTVAVVASTPMLSRKMVNIADAGGSGISQSGGAHGRFEAYTREIVKFGADAYEKVKNATSTTIAYRRLDDSEYKTYTTNYPTVANGKKATLYEEYSDVTLIDGGSGVELRVNGTKKKFAVGENVIIDDGNVKYVKGTLSTDNKNFTKTSDEITNDSSNVRVIEGFLAQKHSRKSSDNNTLWHVSVNAIDPTITTIPWQKLTVGTDVKIDEPIPQDEHGNYVTSFNPSADLKNIEVHAVGGGGAGGRVTNAGGAVKVKDTTRGNALKEDLAQRLEQLGSNYKNMGIAVLNKSNHSDVLNYLKNNNDYFVINLYDGSVSGKIDVRDDKPKVYPHELFKYTTKLGSIAGESVVIGGPVTYTTKQLEGYNVGGTICSEPGGKGPDFTVNTAGTTYDHFDIKDYCSLNKNEIAFGSWVYNDNLGIRQGTHYRIGVDQCCYNNSLVPNSIIYADKECYNLLVEGQDPDWHVRKCISRKGIDFINHKGMTLAGQHEITYHGPNEYDGFYDRWGWNTTTGKHWVFLGCHNDDYWHNVIYKKCAYDCTKDTSGIKLTYNNKTVSSNKLSYTIEKDRCPSAVEKDGRHTARAKLANEFDDSCYRYCHHKYSLGYCKKLEDVVKLSTSNPTCNHHYKGGVGGAKSCTTLCTPAKDGYTSITWKNNTNDGTNGSDLGVYKIGDTINITHGEDGTSRTMTYKTQDVNYFAYASGGKGGGTCKTSADTSRNTLENKTSMPKSIENIAAKKTSYTVKMSSFSDTKKCGSTCSGARAAAGKSAAYNNNVELTNQCPSSKSGGIDKNTTGIYNDKYVWTIPYAYNVLVYGNTGKAGSYAKNTIPKTNGAITITLGKGATSPTGSGSATTVTMGGSNVVTAHGGGGGSSDSKTDKYELCFAGNSNILGATQKCDGKTCCEQDKNGKSTKGVSIQKVAKSSFDSAMAKSSGIIGLGLGRGGVGYNSVAGCEKTNGTAWFYNISYFENGSRINKLINQSS